MIRSTPCVKKNGLIEKTESLGEESPETFNENSREEQRPLAAIPLHEIEDQAYDEEDKEELKGAGAARNDRSG